MTNNQSVRHEIEIVTSYLYEYINNKICKNSNSSWLKGLQVPTNGLHEEKHNLASTKTLPWCLKVLYEGLCHKQTPLLKTVTLNTGLC